MKLSASELKTFYTAKIAPQIIEIPSFKYIILSGQGDPNKDDFGKAMEALYSLTYAIKMSYKSANPPQGYYPYKVFPLEGEWDLIDKTKPVTDKSNYAYTLMIQQPDFVDEELFEQFLTNVKKKKQNPKLDSLRYHETSDGLCCQILHIGSYDEEPTSFAKMMQFCVDKGYRRTSKLHKEIYLSDPRKSEPAKLKTILRFRVEKII